MNEGQIKELASRIVSDLNEKGAKLGSVSNMIIEQSLVDYGLLGDSE